MSRGNDLFLQTHCPRCWPRSWQHNQHFPHVGWKPGSHTGFLIALKFIPQSGTHFCQLFLCNCSQLCFLLSSHGHGLGPNPRPLLPALFNIYKRAIYLFRGDSQKLPKWFMFMGEKNLQNTDQQRKRRKERRLERRKGKVTCFTVQITSLLTLWGFCSYLSKYSHI